MGRRGGEGIAEYKNALLDTWVGGTVLVKQLDAPGLSGDLVEKMLADPKTYRSEPLRARTMVLELEGYDGVGVVLLLPGEEPREQIFVPWSAVIELALMESPAAPERDAMEG